MVRKIKEIIWTEELKVIYFYYKFDLLKWVLNYLGPYHLPSYVQAFELAKKSLFNIKIFSFTFEVYKS